MRQTFDKGVVVAVGLVVALLVGNAGLAYRNTWQLLEDAGWVAHTHEVLDRTSEALRTLVDAETGQRGFLLTGKESFLEPYNQAVPELEGQLQTLKEKTADNPRQRAFIEELKKLTAERLALLQTGIDLRRHSAEEARALVATGQGKEKMDAIRRLIVKMEAEEHSLLRVRERQTARAYRNAVATELVAAAVGLALLGGLVYLVRASLGERTRAAALLQEQREQLHITLTSIGDAVIVTDNVGRVTLMNPVAETVTGWKDGAVGRPLEEVFHIVNEQSRQTVESPVMKVIREGVVVGLANHTALITRGGTEVPIDDSGAPIRNAEGAIVGVVLVFRDVTQRRELERLQQDLQAQLERQVLERTAELRASEERFRLLVESTQDYAIFLLDTEGRVVSWNPGAQRINGYRADEIIGRHFALFYPPEAVGRGWPAHELEVVATKGRFEDEGWRVRQDGSTYWANVVITALYDEAGKLRGFSKITRDLTERKRAEESARRLLEEQSSRRAAEEGQRQLRASEERLHLFVGHAPAAIAMFDRDMHYLLVSRRWLSDYGLADRDIIGSRHYDVFPDMPPQWKEVHRRCLEGAVERCDEDRFQRADGVMDWLRWEVRPWRNLGGEIGGIIIFSEVITERKRAEQAAQFLANASKSLAALVDSGSTMQELARLAVPTFADWCAVDVVENGSTVRRLAVAHADPAKVELAHALERRYPPDPAAPLSSANVLRTGKSEMLAKIPASVLAASAKDQEHLHLLRELGFNSYICVPLAARGKMVAVITLVSGESGRRYDAKDLAVAEELAHRAGIAIENARLYGELREADRRKDEFLAMLAHELRNPLAPIRNALHIMKQPGAGAAMIERVREIMERQVQHMTRMVDDLLDVSRITRGKIELRNEVVDLATVVGRTVETSRPLLEDRHQDLTLDLPPDPLRLKADPTRLEQVLANLLNNAAKYTDHGGHIKLSARLEGSELVVRVHDTGVGIAPDMLTRIFEPFVQSGRVLHHSQGGLGIGLTLVRSLVEMHGGTVTAHSEGPGKGSEFIVRLPALATTRQTTGPTAAREGSAPAHVVPTRRILVVDDNVDAAESLALLLRLEGHEVRVAHDGHDALAMVEADPPDLVFLDIGMPVINGYEVAQRLRRRPGLEKLLLVAMTGWGQEEDRRRSKEAGFDHHLVKPVEPDALHKLLAAEMARSSDH